MELYGGKGPDGLVFLGEKVAPFRRRTFGRKGRKARTAVGVPGELSFLRSPPHKRTMVRAGQSSEKAALIDQCSDGDRQQEVAAGLDVTVCKARQEAAARPGDQDPARIRHATADHPAQQKGPGL